MSDSVTHSDPAPEAGAQGQVDQAVARGGAYEVLRRRLTEQGERLRSVVDGLNRQRLAEFGDSRLEVTGRFRIRTENNCVGRDVVQVGADMLLFGYNVFIGLKTQTRIEDVFGLYRLVQGGEGYDVVPLELKDSFLGQSGFVHDFTELYAYYKHARLLQLIVVGGKLLAAFQIGERSTDVRVFRWSIDAAGALTYLDARGERDIALPPPFDFEWTRATREMAVSGRHSHLNILDTLFVETIGGDLTIKVENNTETGKGIYSEPVEDSTQSLDDAQFDFAKVGTLILLKVLPYRESTWRGLIYNTLTGHIVRNDAIVQACVQLPEDHGIIFPGGYYLQGGEHKAFDAGMAGMQFKRAIRSPNGEDVLYIFYEREGGKSALFVYNTIQRALQNPVFGHGYALLQDGRMVLFHAEGNEPTRIHPMQVWQTPFTSDEFAANRPASDSFMGRIGNAELVRGISNLLGLSREIEGDDVSVQRYQRLVGDARRLFDAHHWLDDAHCDGAATLLREITATGESVLDEYEKVQAIRQQSDQAMVEATAAHKALLNRLQPENWTQVQAFVEALNAISAQRGQLLTIRDYRYIDTAAIDAMAQALQLAHERVGAATGVFLAGDTALAPFNARLDELDAGVKAATSARQLAEQLQAMQAMSADLDMLSELMAGLKVDDATQRTRVVEAISGIYARLNQARARAEQQRKSLGSAEAVAQFGAQFALFSQAITSALSLATDPERADEQLSRLMVQLEELESQFGEHEQFLGDILAKREELVEAFETHKQALLDDRQRKAQSVLDAANRILDGLGRRTERFTSPDELNAFFAGDPLILKLRELAERLRGYRDSVKADDIEARLKGTRDQAVRALRDRSDLFEADGNVVKLGPRHRFSVNTQPLDLTILPRGDTLALHLTGTDFLEPIHDAELAELQPYWQVALDSESPVLYRGEYLAGCILQSAIRGGDGLDLASLQHQAAEPEALAKVVRDFAAPRYREGYERGIHDHDAAAILRAFLPLHRAAGALTHPPQARALALLFWAQHQQRQDAMQWPARQAGADAILRLFGSREGVEALQAEMAAALVMFVEGECLPIPTSQAVAAAAYLAEELGQPEPVFVFSRYGRALVDGLHQRLDAAGLREGFEKALDHPASSITARWELAIQWLHGLCRDPQFAPQAGYVAEAAAMLLTARALRGRNSDVALMGTVEGLLGEHPRIVQGRLVLAVDDFLARMAEHTGQFVVGFQRYQAVRQKIIAREREGLRLSEFKARPLSSFVRNKLINEVYLSIIGDNLAKQMGTVGENKRSDLMGLLMMISPPGYGKTTLMEYVASRLGLVFMKINGPALGHEVRSLDPTQAPDATSRQELEKLNLALEMGNNTMLYVDDIQHTHPEFLQKFISLCDGTRRIEGVWKGRTRTYDMRGKKFCVVMAGNPYTESGELFKIPDMLANRADIYNLGDVLGGMEDAFTLSYIENSLTSNPVLAPLATRDMADLYLLVDRARGKEVSTNALSHAYSGAETNEIVATLQRLLQVRDVVYRVNQQYIASAAQDDRYRTEPPFRLQGSYRNMNKLAEKVSPVMNAAELQQLISDHYLGEAQLLTTGAEENLLKLAELRGVLDETQAARWAQIKRDFLRNKAMGADDADVGGRVVAQLADIAGGLQALQVAPSEAAPAAPEVPWQHIVTLLQQLASTREAAPKVDPLQGVPEALRAAIEPLLEAVRQSQQGQAQANAALAGLAELARERTAAAPVPAQRTRRARTPQEKRLDEALLRHFYGESALREDAAGEGAAPP
ncbi:AAA domain (dynein-related subfamily) [Pseudoxanthomonas sp. GM95]|uniref:DNA repair ATPase n=1 Tax=Pseudoxanthomonas sp. GM95 TaxID=1881043 RepID=UPI0008ACC223|nr:DNA repair ATPase [Pseudoxanthomonas sp. GM95]SEK88750.1 AAA domain (dynein-related subfamily) [Pseudoxanthomonas sp. GM95]